MRFSLEVAHHSHIFHRGHLSRVVNEYGETGVISEWGYYKSWVHENAIHEEDRGHPSSGAYIFRPDIPDSTLQTLKPIPAETRVFESDILTEVHTSFEGKWIHQVTKVYHNENYIDIDFTVGPIPIHDGIGKEVVNRFRTSIQNKGVFFTDSNGREFLRRQRSSRPTWDLEEFEPVAGNYYPINAAIYMEDDDSSISVLTDRSKGGGSIKDGTLELMVHRRIIEDDSRGVGEALNETESIEAYPPFGDASRIGDGLIISGTHRLYIGGKKSGAVMAREGMDKMFSPPFVFASTSPFKDFNQFKTAIHLPDNLQLVTTKLIGYDDENKALLIRIAHAYGGNECAMRSKPVHLNMAAVFPESRVVKVTEKTLTANQDKIAWDTNKMNWNQKHLQNSIKEELVMTRKEEQGIIIIKPMEVRTFVVILDK